MPANVLIGMKMTLGQMTLWDARIRRARHLSVPE